MEQTALAGDPRLAQQAAQQAVAEATQSRVQLKHYALVVKQLPLQIRQHGLGQSLLYLKQRGAERETSPFLVLYRQIGRLVGPVFAADGDALGMITANNSHSYLRATQQTQTFLSNLTVLLEKFS